MSEMQHKRHSPEELEKLVWDHVGYKSVESQGRLDFMMEAHKRIGEGDLVIDAASGRSWYYPFFEHARYVAIDCRQYSKKLQESTGHLSIEADVVNIPIRSNYADTVLSISMLEHMSEPQQFLREAFRILKPGGQLCLFVPFSAPVWHVR